MKLTGKAKKDFKLYWEKRFQDHNKGADISPEAMDECYVQFMYLRPPSEQWGAFVDWGDSVGIDICVFRDYMPLNTERSFYWGVEEVNGKLEHSGHSDTRKEARVKAIEKLDEIYNSKT